MFAHVMSFYSLGYHEVLKLPLRMFWHLVDSIPRIEAYRAKRALSVAACAQSPKGIEEMGKSLDAELGEVVTSQAAGTKRHPDEIPVPSKEQREHAFDRLAALM